MSIPRENLFLSTISVPELYLNHFLLFCLLSGMKGLELRWSGQIEENLKIIRPEKANVVFQGKSECQGSKQRMTHACENVRRAQKNKILKEKKMCSAWSTHPPSFFLCSQKKWNIFLLYFCLNCYFM